MNRTRRRVKGRRETGSFVTLPHICLQHKNFAVLSPCAVKLLIDLYADYRGCNNGDLCCSWALMRKKGWKSRDTLNKARKELLYHNWILCSRQGGKNRASLYAVTFISIDYCKGKLDIQETSTPPGNWKNEKKLTWKEAEKESKKTESLARQACQLSTPIVPMKWKRPYYHVTSTPIVPVSPLLTQSLARIPVTSIDLCHRVHDEAC